MPYRVSVGYTNQNGILKTSKFERYTGSVNLAPSLFEDHLNINFNAKGMISNNRFADTGAIGAAIAFDPTQPVMNGNSKYGGYFAWENAGEFISIATKNPVAMLQQKKESVSMPTAKLTGEKRIPDVDMDIREISYTIMKDEEEMTYFKRFIFRDNCMYQLTIGGKTEDLEELESQRDKFFNSVKFDQNTRK